MELEKCTHDPAVIRELGHRLARRRIDCSLTQAELARRAGVGKRTLERLEAGGTVQLNTFLRILRELGLLSSLDSLVPPEGPRPLDMVKLRKKTRQRVRHGTASGRTVPDWNWGDGK